MEDIYQCYADQVKRFLVCLTGDPALAEELTQETFYQAVKSFSRYDGSCKTSVWLCQIAKHCWYDHLKRQRRHPSVSLEALCQGGEEPAAGEEDGLPEISLLRRGTAACPSTRPSTVCGSPIGRSSFCGRCRS